MDLRRILGVFGRRVGDFLETLGFGDFCNPSLAIASCLRLGGGGFWYLFGVFFGPRFRTALFVSFDRFLNHPGLLLGGLWFSFRHLFYSGFFDGFGGPARASGGGCHWRWRHSRLVCFVHVTP